MSFRRSSSLSREDGLTLEQRLVMQLTAAIRQDDGTEAVEEHPAEAHAADPGNQPSNPEQLPAHSESGQREHSYANAHNPSAHLGAAISGGHNDHPAIDANELSAMLRTLGASLESLGSAIGGHSANALSGAQPHSSQVLNQRGDQGHKQDLGSGSSTGGLDMSSLLQLGNLGNLLSSAGITDQSGLNLGVSMETLGNLDLGSLASLGALSNAPQASGNPRTHRDDNHFQQHQHQQQQQQLPLSESLAHAAQEASKLSSTTDSRGSPGHAIDHRQPSQLHSGTIDSNTTQSPGAGRSTTLHSEPLSSQSLGLSQVEIDPDVSSIQSVLQALLTGSSSAYEDPPATHEASTEPPSRSLSVEPSVEPSNSGTQLGGDLSQDVQLPSLSSFGLGTEDQMLVDSLRSAIENQMPSRNSASEPGTSSLPTSAGADSSKSYRAQASSSRATPKPRPATRTRKPRSQASSHLDDLSISTFSDQSSDFSASDPDTLRAIQQALLSALGPSASSTSLAEPLASGITSDSARLVGDSARSSTTAASRASNSAAASASSSLAAALGPQAQRELRKELESSILPSSAAKAAGRILRAAPSKKVTAKVTKPTERDRQKLREENAARKRRWREENVLQNRDNDLRARIIRRAQTMFGEGDSTEKAEWIEAEYQRRRQKRILRADINNLVANAMESARSRVAAGQDAATGAPRQPLTLTQQTRQIASSQLSELFKRSNAVLEPQLQSEKLTVPLAPYLLVPSPNRPPYKLKWAQKTNINAKSGSNITPTTVSVEPKAPSEALGIKTGGDSGADENVRTSMTSEGPVRDADKPKQESTKTSYLGTSVPRGEERGAEEASSKGEKSLGEADETGASMISSGEKESRNMPFPTRPKHRYGLIGNAQLGVPPNLAAIYRRVSSVKAAAAPEHA